MLLLDLLLSFKTQLTSKLNTSLSSARTEANFLSLRYEAYWYLSPLEMPPFVTKSGCIHLTKLLQ